MRHPSPPLWLLFALPLLAAACAPYSQAPAPISREAPLAGACDASKAQQFIGAPVSDEMRTALIQATGAKSFEWLAPGAMATMDYAPDRLRVSHDADGRIDSIVCG